MAFPFDPPGYLGLSSSPTPATEVPPTELRPASEPPRPIGAASRDARALKILAKTIHRELAQNGLLAEDVMAIAGELLSLVTADVRGRRRANG
jgi:biotin synthase-related radical SAM superfamily protein